MVWADDSLAVRDTGIEKATDGLAGAVVVAAYSEPASTLLTHDGEFVFLVGLAGEAVLDVAGRLVALTPRTSIAIPAGTSWCWSTHQLGHEALVVSLPADAVRVG